MKLSATLKKPLVSVVVPVYKVEDVIARCLDSLCRQSLRDIEIILIDDGSPDWCGKICEQYASEDMRIKVFHHQENRGLSAARNTGIAHTSAAYLMFVDSDDWVHEDFCKQPYECAVRYNADIVMFPFQRLDKNNVLRPVKKAKVQSFSRLTHMEALKLLLHEVGNPAWNKLYSRKLFDTISFPEGYFYEDIATTYKVVLSADTIYYLDTVLYFHCYHEGSITTLKTEKALQNYFEMHMRQYLMLSAWNYPADQLDILLNNIAFTYCMRKKADEGDANYVFCKKVLLSENKKLEDFTWRRKMLIVLLRYCPPLFDLVCEMWGKR